MHKHTNTRIFRTMGEARFLHFEQPRSEQPDVQAEKNDQPKEPTEKELLAKKKVLCDELRKAPQMIQLCNDKEERWREWGAKTTEFYSKRGEAVPPEDLAKLQRNIADAIEGRQKWEALPARIAAIDNQLCVLRQRDAGAKKPAAKKPDVVKPATPEAKPEKKKMPESKQEIPKTKPSDKQQEKKPDTSSQKPEKKEVQTNPERTPIQSEIDRKVDENYPLFDYRIHDLYPALWRLVDPPASVFGEPMSVRAANRWSKAQITWREPSPFELLAFNALQNAKGDMKRGAQEFVKLLDQYRRKDTSEEEYKVICEKILGTSFVRKGTTDEKKLEPKIESKPINILSFSYTPLSRTHYDQYHQLHPHSAVQGLVLQRRVERHSRAAAHGIDPADWE